MENSLKNNNTKITQISLYNKTRTKYVMKTKIIIHGIYSKKTKKSIEKGKHKISQM